MLLSELKPGHLIQTSETFTSKFPPETIFEVVEGWDGAPITEGHMWVLVWCPLKDENNQPSPWHGRSHVHGYTKLELTKALQHGQCWAKIDGNTVQVPGSW